MFCSNCGNQLNEEVKFCVNCGTKVAGFAEEQAAQPVIAETQEADKEEKHGKINGKIMKILAITLVVASGLAILTRQYGILPDGRWVDIICITFVLCFFIPVIPFVIGKITKWKEWEF